MMWGNAYEVIGLQWEVSSQFLKEKKFLANRRENTPHMDCLWLVNLGEICLCASLPLSVLSKMS